MIFAARMAVAPVVGVVLAVLGGCASAGPGNTVYEDVPGAVVGLTVRVVGAASDEGWVAVAAYGSADTFAERRDPVAAVRLQVEDGGAIWQVPVLEPGRYAIAAFHDVDADGQLDRSAVGVPSEPYGFSNGARGRLGPPSFDAAAVTLGGGSRELIINLR